MLTGDLPYSFHLAAESAMINAFSLPGGPVYVGEGLLDLMTSEDQLASVLGHEIEHIDHYHCAERVQMEARLRNLKLEVVGALVQIPLSVWEAGYNKDEELEADREGMRVAVLGGYSPYGAVTLFEKFAKLHKRIHHSCAEPRRRTFATRNSKSGRVFPFTSSTLGTARASECTDCARGLARPQGAKAISRRV